MRVTPWLAACLVLLLVTSASAQEWDNFVFVEDGLPSPGQVDDAQTTHPDPEVAADVDSLVVGPAMDDAVAHPPDERPLDGA